MVSAIGVMRVMGAGVAVGMERSDVEAALGKPSAVLQRENRQVLVYPNNGRVELADGRVVEMANVAVSDEAFEAPETSAPPALDSPATPKVTKSGEEDDEQPDAKPRRAAASTSGSPPPSSASAVPTDDEEETENHESAALPVLAVLIVGACRTVIMIVVLKLAFKWADVHADWSQMIAPAISDTVVRIAIVLIAEKLFETSDLFYADEALAYFALIFVLMKTTHACTLSRALGVAAAAKLVSIVVGSLIVVLVLNLLG
jgi:hypothetical protein